MYVVVRIVAFVVPLAATVTTVPDARWGWIIGAVAGAAVSQAISTIFLERPRARMSEDLARLAARFERGRRRGAEPEDAELDAADPKSDD